MSRATFFAAAIAALVLAACSGGGKMDAGPPPDCLDDTGCNGHGTCANGTCTCTKGFAGATCSRCASNYFNYPTCTFCSAGMTCNGNGSCTPMGACSCSTGFEGADCSRCAPGYLGYPSCSFCEASTTCNAHGTCNATTGACDCDARFSGADCGQCAAGLFDYPNCTGCAAAVTCHGHGTCSGNSCSCNTGFADAGCDQCAPNYYNYPSCTFCSAATTCNGHGACDPGTGVCLCSTGFGDAGCADCAFGYSGYPNCARSVMEQLASNSFADVSGPPDLAFDATGPHVTHIASSTSLFVAKIVNANWQDLGGQVNDNGTNVTAYRPQIVVSPNGPLVAFAQGSAIKTRQYSGGTWNDLAFTHGTLSTDKRAFDLVLDSLARPTVVYVEAGQLRVKRLESGVWNTVGTAFQSGVTSVVAAARNDGTLFVAARTAATGAGFFVATQSSTGTWALVGSNPIDSIPDMTQTLAATDVDVNATSAFVSWNKGTSPNMPRFVASWSGMAWSNVNTMGQLGDDVSTAIDGVGLVQIFRPSSTGNAYSAQRWSGSSWGTATALSFTANNAELFAESNVLYITYADTGGQGHVARLNLP